MSSPNWSTLSKSQQAREDFYLSGAPVDPIALHQKHGGAHYNRSLGTTLMPTSHMSCGPHMEKLMSAVPLAYLAWVNAQPWAKSWHQWAPVAHYLDRYPISRLYLQNLPQPLITLSPAGRLSCPPEHEDKLQTFAKAVLNLDPSAYIPQHRLTPPHYHLTPAQALIATRQGAHPLSVSETARFLRRWEDHLKQCTKHCYGTAQDAADTATVENRTRTAKGLPPLTYVYCHTCEFWHLTTAPAE
jgi:hypothetical protein